MTVPQQFAPGTKTSFWSRLWEWILSRFNGNTAVVAPEGPTHYPGITTRFELPVEAPLPSKDEPFTFDCQFLATYEIHGPHDASQEIASRVKQDLLDRSLAIASRYALSQAQHLTAALNDELNQRRSLGGFRAEYVGHCLDISFDPREGDLANRIAQIVHDHQVQKHRDEVIGDRIGYYLSTFKDPMNASLWWLAKNPEQVERLPEIADIFDSFFTKAGKPAPAPVDSVGQFFTEYFASASEPEKSAIREMVKSALRNPDIDARWLERWEHVSQATT